VERWSGGWRRRGRSEGRIEVSESPQAIRPVISFLLGKVGDGSSEPSAQLVSMDIALFPTNAEYSDTDGLEGSHDLNRIVTCENEF
jgi:hypothetical protein